MKMNEIAALRDRVERGRATYDVLEPVLTTHVREGETAFRPRDYAELRFWLAEVQSRRLPDRSSAAVLAYDAAQRAAGVRDTVLAIKAQCLGVFCDTYDKPQEEFEAKHAALLELAKQWQAQNPGLTAVLKSEIGWHLEHLLKMREAVR